MSASTEIALEDLDRLTAPGNAPDLADFAESSARAMLEFSGCRAVVLSHLDPARPDLRQDWTLASGGPARRTISPADDGIPARILRKGSRVTLQKGKNDQVLAESEPLLGVPVSTVLGLLAWPLCIVLAFVGVWPFVAGVLFLLWTYTFRFVVDIHARLGLVTTLLARDINYLSMHVKQIQDAFPEKKWLDAEGGVMHVYTAVRNGDSLL